MSSWCVCMCARLRVKVYAKIRKMYIYAHINTSRINECIYTSILRVYWCRVHWLSGIVLACLDSAARLGGALEADVRDKPVWGEVG